MVLAKSIFTEFPDVFVEAFFLKFYLKVLDWEKEDDQSKFSSFHSFQAFLQLAISSAFCSYETRSTKIHCKKYLSIIDKNIDFDLQKVEK